MAQSMSMDALAMYSFVALGLPDGMIGTAWPTLRRGFHVPLEDLGFVLLVATAGALASSSVSGLVLGRLGVRATIMVAGTAGAAGAVGIVLSPAFWVFLISGTAVGVASGLIDSAVNTSAALAGRNRLLNLLHGCYGVGTTIAPLIVTAAVLIGSWRPAYGVVLAVELVLVGGWWLAGRGQAMSGGGQSEAVAVAANLPAPVPHAPVPPGLVSHAPVPHAPVPPGPVPAVGRRLRLALAVTLGLTVFAVYTGLEVTAGQWEPSFDRGPLHMGAGVTGVATFGYWGALTLVRFALAVPRRQFSPAAIVRWGCAISLAGAGVVWWCPSTVAALAGLVVIGGALAGIFPALVVLTPARVGEDMARHVIGWQIGAAGLGGSIISAFSGAVFQHFGLHDFGPALVTVAAVLALGVVALERTSLVGSARWKSS